MTATDPVEARSLLALNIARAAGDLTLQYFHSQQFDVETKGDGSVVTRADREAESLMRRMILDAFPDDGILGEEHDDVSGSSGARWILDPIDGTKSFVQGVPLYGNLVAVEVDGVMEIGVINMPGLSETVHARLGGGAWHETAHAPRMPARVSNVQTLDKALLAITAFDYFADAHRADEFLTLADRFETTRGWSDCYAHVLVATGRADACVEPVLAPWDIAPVLPIMAEAGGRFSDWNADHSAFSGDGISSNGAVHDAVLACLTGSSAE